MKILREKIKHPADCMRICNIAFIYGWHITPLEAQAIWKDHSDSMAAGWLFLPECNSDLWYIIQRYFEE